MDLSQLLRLAITASILLLSFALGLRATFSDAGSFLRQPFRPPRPLLRALLAMTIVVPAMAATLAALLDLTPAVEIALLAVAVSPVPPILPGKQLELGGRESYVYGLLVSVSLAAIVTVPLAVELLGWLFRRDAHIGMADVSRIMGVSILLPLMAGLLGRRVVPGWAERAAPWISRLGTGLLIIGLVPVLASTGPAVVLLLGNGTVLAIFALVVAAIGVGHGLGGPAAEDRTALAIASSMRHPGVALAIARTSFPEETLAPAAILLFLLIGAISTSVYGAWRKRALRGGAG